ncbi:MAG: aldo/keto reductase [Lachnospiraceae bacterium]
MELCLGTVQFGMDYGIRNQKQPSVEQAVQMLDYATQNGISSIDTANAYGTAEDVVGEFLKKKTIAREKLFIISKFKPNLLDEVDEGKYYQVMKDNLQNSLSRLRTDYLDSYLLHSARYVWNDAIIDTLNRMKQEGYVRHVGVSVYETDEAKKCIERPNVEFMQVPYSIFDQRMKTDGVFELAKKAEHPTQIHSRSAFIQGLILMKEEEVPDFLADARPIIKEINQICVDYNISKIQLAMSYVMHENCISHLVFGVDNLEQLKENVSLKNNLLQKNVVEEIAKRFTNIDAEIVMPSLWKK